MSWSVYSAGVSAHEFSVRYEPALHLYWLIVCLLNMCANARAHARNKHRTHRQRSAPSIHIHTHIKQYTCIGRCTSAHSACTHMCPRTPNHTGWYLRACTHKHFDTHFCVGIFAIKLWTSSSGSFGGKKTCHLKKKKSIRTSVCC